MLVLSRNPGQKIIINDDLIITFVKICRKTGKINLSFKGDANKYHILREELK